MATVPTRACAVVLAVAVNETVPLPVPVALPLILSHPVALLTAVHTHPAPVVTPVVVLAAVEPMFRLVGFKEYVQADPACETVKV